MTTKLENMRHSKGMSQRQLERITGVHQQIISKHEKGQYITKLAHYERLAKALDCKISDLTESGCNFENMTVDNFKNLHTYLKATRELLGINPRKLAAFLDMNEREYLDYEDEATELSREDALSLASVMMFCFAAEQISTTLRTPVTEPETDGFEQEILKAVKALSPENQERALNLIKAAPLLK